MSTRAGQRVAALVLAGVFFFSSVALTIFVVYQIRKDSKDPNGAIAASQNKSQDTTNGTKLAGTKLAGFTPLTTPITTLQSKDLITGKGDIVAARANVTVHYTGALASTGVIFESSKDSGKPATFGLDQVIKGWTDGVPGMHVGGVRQLVIPAAQAYGEKGSGSTIPPNSDLVFEITLISIN